MENAVLWQTFSNLNNLERKHFGQWLESPFFCRRSSPAVLFGYLQQCLAGGKAPDAAEAAGICGVQGTQAFRLLMSEVLSQLEHFLVYRELFDRRAEFSVHLAAAYRKRGLDKQFLRALRDARRDWQEQPYRHTEYYEAQTAIEYEQYQFLSSRSRTEALNLQELFDAADLSFITRKLRQACFAITHQTVYKAEYRLGLFREVSHYIERTPALLELPAIALYYYCYNFLAFPEEESHFTRFKTLLFTQTGRLPPGEQRDLHLLAINYCIKKINQSEQRYLHEAFDLYQSALQGELLLENGVLSHFAFNNIVASALHVGETAWTEQFILDHGKFLEKKHREANVQLNLARVAYVRRDYRRALLHLQAADYKDLINNLIAKTLLLKIYFETGEFDALDAHLQSMQIFLRRQRVIGYHKTNYQNIIRFTRKLVQLNPADRREKEALALQIAAENPLTEKEWLEKMVREA